MLRARFGWLARLLLFGGLCFFGMLVLGASTAVVVWFKGDYVPMEVGILPPVLAALAASVFMMVRVERRPISALGLTVSRQAALDLGAGAIGGVILIGAVSAIGAAAGWVSWERGPDAAGVALLLLFSTALFLLAASFAEELLFRGYPLQVLGRRFGGAVAVGATSVVFAAAHAANPDTTALSFINTTLAGALLGTVYWRTFSLWLVTGLHMGWNLAMAGLGLSVSGLSIGGAGFVAHVTGPELWMGAGYGPEGGLIVTFLSGAALAWAARTDWLRRRETVLRRGPLTEITSGDPI